MQTNFSVSFTLRGKTAIINESFKLAGIEVPKGFESDGISSPRVVWFKFHPFSQYCPAAFVHDFCIVELGYPKARDKFNEAIKELGARDWERKSLYYAVRLKDWQRRLFKKLGVGDDSKNSTGGRSD